MRPSEKLASREETAQNATEVDPAPDLPYKDAPAASQKGTGTVRKQIHRLHQLTTTKRANFFSLLRSRNRGHATDMSGDPSAADESAADPSPADPSLASPTAPGKPEPSSLVEGRPELGPCIVSIDVPDPDNFLMVLRVILDHPNNRVDIVISPRPVSFVAIPYGDAFKNLLKNHSVSAAV